MASKKRDLVKMEPMPPMASPPLLEDLRRMIEETRQDAAATVNAALTLLYWRIGKRIDEEILKGGRAEYGKEIVRSLARQLSGLRERVLREKPAAHASFFRGLSR